MQLWLGVIFVPQMEECSHKAERVRNNTKFSLTALNGTLPTLTFITFTYIHHIYIRPSISPISVCLIILIVLSLEVLL